MATWILKSFEEKGSIPFLSRPEDPEGDFRNTMTTASSVQHRWKRAMIQWSRR